jgi:hypothetical protein
MIALQCVSNREEIKQRCAYPSRYLCGIAAVDLPCRSERY